MQSENRIETEHRMLECDRIETEAARMGRDIAALQGRKRELEEQRKSSAKALKDEIDAVDGRIDAIAKSLRKGVEERTVEVRIEHDFAKNCIRSTRLDTLEVIEERVMPPEDRQEEFELDDQKAEPTPDEAFAQALATLTDEQLQDRLKTERDAYFEAQGSDENEAARLKVVVEAIEAEVERRSAANEAADEAG